MVVEWDWTLEWTAEWTVDQTQEEEQTIVGCSVVVIIVIIILCEIGWRYKKEKTWRIFVTKRSSEKYGHGKTTACEM